MKLVFLSNYFNHHQEPVSDVFYKKLGDKYKFIQTIGIPKERIKVGYGTKSLPSYVIDISNDKDRGKNINILINESDVLITGSAPEDLLSERINRKQLIFRYSERPLKKGLELLKYPVRYIRWNQRNPGDAPIYMLCASAYTAGDYQKFGLFKNKAFKWGYFTETKKYEKVEEILSEKSKSTILWAGRFLYWKHVDDIISVSKRLKDDGYDFKVELIGMGEMLPELQKMVAENQLNDTVQFLGSMKPEQVREHMEKAGIYLFTSDKQEGWGAVLNESMNSGCAVVASHEIGAVPYLVNDGENGLVYESGNIDMLYQKTKYLLDHPEEQERLGKAAYKTIVDEWNAEVAAERFIQLAEKLLKNEPVNQLFKTGPCSPAEIISDKWNKR